jgi:hypothetical protein
VIGQPYAPLASKTVLDKLDMSRSIGVALDAAMAPRRRAFATSLAPANAFELATKQGMRAKLGAVEGFSKHFAAESSALAVGLDRHSAASIFKGLDLARAEHAKLGFMSSAMKAAGIGEGYTSALKEITRIGEGYTSSAMKAAAIGEGYRSTLKEITRIGEAYSSSALKASIAAPRSVQIANQIAGTLGVTAASRLAVNLDALAIKPSYAMLDTLNTASQLAASFGAIGDSFRYGPFEPSADVAIGGEAAARVVDVLDELAPGSARQDGQRIWIPSAAQRRLILDTLAVLWAIAEGATVPIVFSLAWLLSDWAEYRRQ